MGLHALHLDLGVAVRWSARLTATLTAAGYAAEYLFAPGGAASLRLAWRSLVAWATGGTPSASVPQAAWHAMLATVAIPPAGALAVVAGVWLLVLARRLRRPRRRPAGGDEADQERGARIVSADTLARRINDRGHGGV